MFYDAKLGSLLSLYFFVPVCINFASTMTRPRQTMTATLGDEAKGLFGSRSSTVLHSTDPPARRARHSRAVRGGITHRDIGLSRTVHHRYQPI